MCSEIQNSVKILLTMAHDELSPISSCSFIPDAITLLQTIIIYHLNFRNTSCLGSEFSHFFSPIRFFFFFLYYSHSIVSEVEHCYHFASNSFNVFIFRKKLKLFVIPSDYILALLLSPFCIHLLYSIFKGY